MRSAVSAAVFLALVGLGAGVSAQTTDLLLVLAADVSRSIDESEFALQRKGYSAALTDPRVLAAIRGGTTGTIAICFVEWSGAGEQNVVADWTVIHDEEVVGTFNTFEEAANTAVAKFGRGPYLIRQIGAAPLTLPVSVLHHPAHA